MSAIDAYVSARALGLSPLQAWKLAMSPTRYEMLAALQDK